MTSLASCMLVVLAAQLAPAQDAEPAHTWPTIGTREIDKLPRSDYAEALWRTPEWYWTPPDQAIIPALAVHLKPSFRIGNARMERLCVVEAVAPGGRRQHGALRFTGPGLDAERRIGWLAHKPQYRPMWLPVMPEECAATLLVDDEPLARAQFATAQDAPPGLFEVRITDEPPYVDHGYGLLPARQSMAHPGQPVHIRFAPRPAPGGSARVRGALTDADGVTKASFRGTVTLPNGTTAEGKLDTTRLRPGVYDLNLRASFSDGQVVTDRRQLIIVKRVRDPGFGAHYADLTYTAPVYVSRESTESWADLWRGSALRDVVVTFPHSSSRYVFWRGTSYVPCWAFNDAWLTYEWFEAEPDFGGAIGCVEPIMDKSCRHSRATIISSTPARVVIHWRYALTDFAEKIINDEWADEYYCFYPDGVGARLLVGWMKSGWHENQEFIVLNRPGNAPHESLEPQAVTFLTTDGRSRRPVWPRPFFCLDDWPHIIAKVNIPGRPSPFMVVDDADATVKVWSEPYVDKPGIFNTYTHWPVSRGIRTTWLDDPADWHRPTHSNLVNIVHDEAVRADDHRIWYWLIGVAEREKDLRALAAGWLDPGTISVTPGVVWGYDRAQRAYIISTETHNTRLRIDVEPGDSPIVNPAFVISGARRHLSHATCTGPAQRIELGRENGGEDLVVWIEGSFPRAFTLTLN